MASIVLIILHLVVSSLKTAFVVRGSLLYLSWTSPHYGCSLASPPYASTHGTLRGCVVAHGSATGRVLTTPQPRW
jgi:hypothetical protein